MAGGGWVLMENSHTLNTPESTGQGGIAKNYPNSNIGTDMLR